MGSWINSLNTLLCILRYDKLIYMIFDSLNIEIFNIFMKKMLMVMMYQLWCTNNDVPHDDKIFHFTGMVTVCYRWTGSQGACTTWCPAPSSPDRRGRSSWTSVARGRSLWLRYSSARGCWGWGYRRSSETKDKRDCFSWINKVQMRFDHHISDTVVAYMLGRGRGS